MTASERKASRWAAKAHHIYRSGETVDGRFAVLRPLAAGGMAEVYEALDTQTGELVALKTPNQRYADDPKIVDRMIREARALAVMPHPSLVHVIEAGSDDGQFYFAMELLDGQTLKELRASQEVPLGVALSIVKQLASGLHGLHKARMIHRDMKPDNVMVMEDVGKPEHAVKIFDLGIAKFLDASTTSQGLTLGTVSYMAPEQAFGGKVDLRCDIYALGLMLYELIAQVHPLCIDSRPQSAQEWATRQRDLEPPRLDVYMPGTHPLVSNLVAKAIAKSPAQRWPSAKELAIQIEAVIATLTGLGKIDSLRLDRFRPEEPSAEQSGPQPIVVARPPNVSTPHAGMAYRRTDQAETLEPEPPPVALRAEPPRVAPQSSERTPRGTIPMVGPKGTKPLLEVRPNLAYAEALRSHDPKPADPEPAADRGHDARATRPRDAGPRAADTPLDLSSNAKPKAAWRAAPAASLRLASVEELEAPGPEPVGTGREPEAIARAIEPFALVWHLKAIALGLAVACVGIGVATLVLLGERRDAGPVALPVPTGTTLVLHTAAAEAGAPATASTSGSLAPATSETTPNIAPASPTNSAGARPGPTASPMPKLGPIARPAGSLPTSGAKPASAAPTSSAKPTSAPIDGPIDIFPRTH